MCQGVYVEIRGRLGDSVSFLTIWVSKNPTQVVRFGTRHFSPLSHPAGSLINYFINRRNKWMRDFVFSHTRKSYLVTKLLMTFKPLCPEPFFIIPSLPKFPKHDPFFMWVNTLNFIL